MKVYKKLPLPKEPSLNKKTWLRFIHWRIIYFFEGIRNIIRWLPTIYNDKNYDHFFLMKILSKKIEFHREHLVNNGLHENVGRDNFWMTVVLNLIERSNTSYYLDEQEIMNHDLFLSKYPASVRKVIRDNPTVDFSNKRKLSIYVGFYNDQRCKDLIFEILKHKHDQWWD